MAKHISSSSSEGEERTSLEIVDDKKRKRKISNRESARRSRMRRAEHIKDLNCQITFFRNNNCEIGRKINSVAQQSVAIELENQMLTRVRDELAKRLESLDIVSSYVCGNIEELPQCNSEPWIVSHQYVPLMTSVGLFQY